MAPPTASTRRRRTGSRGYRPARCIWRDPGALLTTPVVGPPAPRGDQYAGRTSRQCGLVRCPLHRFRPPGPARGERGGIVGVVEFRDGRLKIDGVPGDEVVAALRAAGLSDDAVVAV